MNLRHEPVDIAVDDQQIRGTIVLPAAEREPGPGVLFVHGWGGSQGQYLPRAERVAALGCACLTFDLRGHEATASRHDAVSREENLRDVVAAYDLLERRAGVDPARVALAGSSYGAYLGAIATTLRPVRWLSLRAPAIYKDADWTLPKRELHRDPDFVAYRLRTAGPNRALEACAQFRGDALVVESQEDRVVPHPVVAGYVAALAHARSLTYRVIDGADHGLSREPWKEAYTEFLVAWLQEVMAAAAQPPPRGETAPRTREET